MLKEFREFVARGDVIDLAVAVIIGAAFGRMKSQPPAAAATTKPWPYCLSTIPLPASKCSQCTSTLA
jgi:hypothetical protein